MKGKNRRAPAFPAPGAAVILRASAHFAAFIAVPALVLAWSLGQLKAAGWNMYGDLSAGIAGAGSQLSVTIPALAGTMLGFAAMLAIGAAIAFRLQGKTRLGFPELLLASFVLGALATYPVLLVLGALKAYSAASLALVTLAFAACAFGEGVHAQIASRAREWVSGIPGMFSGEVGWLLLFALIFGGVPCLLLQLASPVPPFMDVAPNHIAPVQQVLTFNEYHPESNNPAPEYGISRVFPGYVSVFSFIASFSGAGAAHAISAFAFFLFLLQICAVFSLGKNLFGEKAGAWAAAFFLLSFAQLRGNDVRATTMVLVFAASALSFYALYSRGKTGVLLPASALAAALLVHPMLGGFAFLALAAVALAYLASGSLGRFARDAQIHSLALLPFAYAMLPLATRFVPAATAYAAIPALASAALLFWAFSKREARAGITAAGAGALLAMQAAFLAFQIRAGNVAFADALRSYPAIAFPGLVGLGLAAWQWCGAFSGAKSGRLGKAASAAPAIALALLLPTLAAATLAPLLPPASGELQSILNELPFKSGVAWATYALVFPAGMLAASVTSRVSSAKGARGVPGFIASLALSSAVLAILIHPVLGIADSGPDTVSEQWGSHALDASRGYFQGWWDSREMIGPEQKWVCDYLAGEARAGRLEYGSLVLQYSGEAFNWIEYPVAAFSGATVALVSDKDEPDNPHMQGSRRTWIANWGGLLSENPDYVLVQKRRGPDFPGALPSAGDAYSLVNDTADFALYRRT
ncbi:MAG: hypothetical protein PHF51_04355 [Candidatus ainarchaeum sp.]|nr:hypothetical protein [Candidatus ainarchaeum sp.]